MTFGAFISRVSGALIAGSLAFTLIFAAVHAAEDQRKVTAGRSLRTAGVSELACRSAGEGDRFAAHPAPSCVCPTPQPNREWSAWPKFG
jgi:hypothetical protein